MWFGSDHLGGLELKLRNKLDKLSEELADLPRHQWDQRLWAFCEELLAQAGPPRREVATSNAGAEPRSRLSDSRERRADGVSCMPSEGK